MKNPSNSEIIKVLNECIWELEEKLDVLGGCDHSAGICVCNLIFTLDDAQVLTARLMGYEVVPDNFGGWEVRGIPREE